jgi:hypothetical protein
MIAITDKGGRRIRIHATRLGGSISLDTNSWPLIEVQSFRYWFHLEVHYMT